MSERIKFFQWGVKTSNPQKLKTRDTGELGILYNVTCGMAVTYCKSLNNKITSVTDARGTDCEASQI